MDYAEFNDYKRWKYSIYEENDKVLFDEIVTCIENEAYRSASVMIWVLCAESLYKKLNILSESNKVLKNDLEKKYLRNKNEFELLNLAKDYNLINDVEYSQLNSVREARNNYAHPTFEEPNKNEVLSSLFYIIDIVLSKSPMYSYTYGENFIKSYLLSDPYYLGDKNDYQIKEFALDFFNRIDSKYYKSYLKLFFRLTEDLLKEHNINNQMCSNVGLIFIENLILLDSNLLKNINEFLDKYKITSCNVFSEEEIWQLLDDNSKFRVFNYSFDFQNNIFTEVEFLNKYFPLYEKDMLEVNFKEKIDEFIDKSSAILILNSSLPLFRLYEKIIHDFKSYDYYIQNDVAKLLKTIDLTLFDENQLEEIGRNLLQAADGGSWTSKRILNFYLENMGDEKIPLSLIRGILFEVFINENNEFRFKEKDSRNVLIKVFNDKCCTSMVEDLLELIKHSIIKNNYFYHYKLAIKKINLLNEQENVKHLEDLINSIQISRCNSINKIFERDSSALFALSEKEMIYPYVFSCLNIENKAEFINFSKENIFDFIKFFSNTRYSLNESKYISIYLEWNLLDQFINLNDLKEIIEKNLEDDNLSFKERDLGKYFLDNYLYHIDGTEYEN